MHACDAIYQIAEKGNKQELKDVILKIKEKYKGIEKIDTAFISFEQTFIYKDEDYKAQVVFEFTDKITIAFKIINKDKGLKRCILQESGYGYLDWMITVFKKIEIKEDMLYLKGSREIEYLPFKVDLSNLK